ncbi:dihydrofolate reductase [Propionibacteriaceae bacterium ES.041]|uniref:Dihydrofolate reductase n=1 Tax=Enemella evansiae TaxID=2016499 RepID=A0A255G2S3_9ACTN|nr:dihydrofolate reductase [Enemella evansiae]PFG66358.1 dihydrofolate reductase [Propionibacteriaceae bacterium ES.041]OYN94285.1 diacylglycerol kinase [Enemella evansiae]OYO04431.1 diacylglycerol kinase [Enemella evansiae]OYO07157.1 diacylglycerol kinase [Enemella evansiae]OYO08666.1 diacylglycerol kinase [Enemella evansiae]
MSVTAIAAVAANGVIGADNDLAWRHREDFAHLKALTMGGVLVMGRKNYESIGRPLPGRDSYVVTRNPDWTADGVRVFGDLDEAIDAALATGKRVWIFGGGEVYAQAWPRTDALEITEVHADLAGDTHFPPVDPAEWTETAREDRDGFSWVSYRRRT